MRSTGNKSEIIIYVKTQKHFAYAHNIRYVMLCYVKTTYRQSLTVNGDNSGVTLSFSLPVKQTNHPVLRKPFLDKWKYPSGIS